MKYTEARLEEAIIRLLGEQGYPHVLGADIYRISGGGVGLQDVILYINGLPLVVFEQAENFKKHGG